MSNTPSIPVLLLRPAEASKALSISPRKLWSLTASGDIPDIRIGRSVRYGAESLRTWILEQQEIQSQRK